MRTRPSTSSAISASRTVGRETFNLFGEIAFGRKPAADGVFAAVDQGAKLIGNLAIQASRFHGLQRHVGFPRCDPWIGCLAWLGHAKIG